MTTVGGNESGLESRAVGRIPSGLFVLSRTTGEHGVGMLVSWVQQAGFEPLTVTVAIRGDRPIAGELVMGQRFVLNQIGEGQTHLIKRFARSSERPGQDFEGLGLVDTEKVRSWAGPVLVDAIACLHVKVIARMEGGDHVILLGEILDGLVHDTDAAPRVHLRKHGSHY